MTKKIWEKYFKPPYKFDDCELYLFDHENQMVLMMADDTPDKDLVRALEKIMNGEPAAGFDVKKFALEEGGEVYAGDKCVFMARGWGYLTASGCCGLPMEEACNIQDAMLEYILDKLNKEGVRGAAENKVLEKVLVDGTFAYGKPLYHSSAEEAERITGGKKFIRSLLKLFKPNRRKGRNR